MAPRKQDQQAVDIAAASESAPRQTKVVQTRPRKKRHSPTTPEAIARLERDMECVRLRRANVGWDAIAKQLGYCDPGHAYKQFMSFMKSYPREDVDDAREVEAQRYDQLLEVLWPQCLEVGSKQHWAIDRVAKLLDQRARLMGWNRPVRQEISVLSESTVDAAIRELQATMEAQARAAGVKIPTDA